MREVKIEDLIFKCMKVVYKKIENGAIRRKRETVDDSEKKVTIRNKKEDI